LIGVDAGILLAAMLAADCRRCPVPSADADLDPIRAACVEAYRQAGV
jgi:hypothetical protein